MTFFQSLAVAEYKKALSAYLAIPINKRFVTLPQFERILRTVRKCEQLNCTRQAGIKYFNSFD